MFQCFDCLSSSGNRHSHVRQLYYVLILVVNLWFYCVLTLEVCLFGLCLYWVPTFVVDLCCSFGQLVFVSSLGLCGRFVVILTSLVVFGPLWLDWLPNLWILLIEGSLGLGFFRHPWGVFLVCIGCIFSDILIFKLFCLEKNKESEYPT